MFLIFDRTLVTEEYQLESATIDGQFYIIADTPGFDDPKTNNVAIFRNIVTLLQLVGNSVEFAGILYVHAMGTTLSTGSSMLLTWLEAFCGPNYYHRVTFVTTMWDELGLRGVQTQNRLLPQWMEKWDNFIQGGSRVYHHGKCYDNGIATDRILDVDTDSEERQHQVWAMISRYHGHGNSLVPRIVEELRRGLAIEDTTAGNALGLQTQQLVAMTQPAQAQQSTQSGERNMEEEPINHSGTETVGWLNILVSVISGTKRAIWDFFLWLRSFLPDSVWYWPRWTERGLEIVIRMPHGTEIAVGMTTRGPYFHIGDRTWFPFSEGEDDRNDGMINLGDDEDFDLVAGEEGYLDPESLDANMLGVNLSDTARSKDEQDFLDAFERAQNAHLDETHTASGLFDWCAIM